MSSLIQEQCEAAWMQREELRRGDSRAPAFSGPPVELCHQAGLDGKPVCGSDAMGYRVVAEDATHVLCSYCKEAKR